MNIKDIVVKMEYFPRINLDEETVTRYMELYELGVNLPPIVVQKEKNILIDGFHRLEAQRRLGWTEIDVEFRDITEDKIFLTTIEDNIGHGRPFSPGDTSKQIRRLRFETTPSLTYAEIGKAVLLSTSRVGEICRGMDFRINGTIIPKIDGRSNLTDAQDEEIHDRIEAGESTSAIAKDYPVGESRISQKRKEPRKSKPYKETKEKTLSQMPPSWTRRSLVQRFKANNPLADSQEIDFDAYLNVRDYESYHDLVDSFREAYPEYEWLYPKERPPFGRHYDIPPESVYDKSIEIRVKLYWTNEGKYAHVKGTIQKKVLEYVRDRLYNELTVNWPLVEAERPDRRVFPELSDEELSERYEKSQEYYREPEDEDDEEMRKWGDLIPEE